MLDTKVLAEAHSAGVLGRELPGIDVKPDMPVEDCALLVHAKALRELPPDRFDEELRKAREGFLMALVYAWLAGARTGGT